MNTYWESAREVKPGDIAVEVDGYCWRVTETRYYNKRVTLTMEPVMATITAREPRVLTVKQSANIRLQSPEVARG